MGKGERFSGPRLDLQGELPEDLLGQDTREHPGDGEIAPPSSTIPKRADYGLGESRRVDGTDLAAPETTE